MGTKIYVGNAMEVLPKLEVNSVHCSVSSPPYYGLRKYEGSQQCEWPEIEYSPMSGLPLIQLPGWRGALGNEPTIEMYIGHLVAIYREVYRCTREDSVVWIVMGDSFSSQGGPEPAQTKWQVDGASNTQAEGKSRRIAKGLAQGNLMMVPHRLALALQADTMGDESWLPGGERGTAWLAGVVDSDGNLGIKCQKRDREKDWAPGFYGYLGVTNSDIELLHECIRVTGLGTVRVKQRPGSDNRGIKQKRTSYSWRLDGDKAVRVIKAIYPYLIIKKQQALLIHNVDVLNKKHRAGAHKRLPKEVVEKKRLLYELCKRRNQRELIDQPAWVEDIPRYTGKPMWIIRNDLVYAKKSPMPESVSGWRWQRHRIKIGREPADWKKLPKGWDVGLGSHDSGIVKGNYRKEGKREATTPIWSDCPGCPKCEANDGYVLKRGSWRHTRAHEFILMCTKKMGYFADQEKVRESLSVAPHKPGWAMTVAERNDKSPENEANLRNWGTTSGRNPRSVLSPSPEPFLGKHFAVFSTNLIEPLIKATCPDKCCPVCGKGWAPTVKRGLTAHDGKTESAYLKGSAANRLALLRQAARERGVEYQSANQVLGYRQTCECGCEESVPGMALDPFSGSGTTGLVCERLGLNSTLIEISRDYAEMARDRVVGDAPLLNRVEVFT